MAEFLRRGVPWGGKRAELAGPGRAGWGGPVGLIRAEPLRAGGDDHPGGHDVAQVPGHHEPVAGNPAVKRNRFIGLSGGIKTVNRALEAKARDLEGLKGASATSLPDPTAATAPSTASAGAHVRATVAPLRLLMMISLKMPRAKWRVVLSCVALMAGIAASAEPVWKEPSLSASPGEAAVRASAAVDSELEALLNAGEPDSAAPARHTSSSPALVAAAAGADNQRFYQLGELLVRDGLSSAIINLSREMNGWWYAWSVWHAPSSELDAFILAWRQVVTTMRSVPGEHFKFLWTIYPKGATVAESWPGSAYVDYIGTDIFDWYGGSNNTYPHTASGALDHAGKWQQILTDQPGGLNWMAAFSQATGKPIIVPEWGLDFHMFGGQDDPQFITNMMAWMKGHHAIGLYWVQGHIRPVSTASGPLLVNQGAAAQINSPGAVNALGDLMGGRLQYAAVYLNDQETISEATAQPVLAPWESAGYRLVLSVDIIPNPAVIRSYSGPSEPGGKPYQLSNYPDAVTALKQAHSNVGVHQ